MADFETDYLIVGAGAVGLAFVDTLIDEDPGCHITIVDKHAKPGGHWNDAYGFVALHQPSGTYGVNSMTFPSEHIDEVGLNKGLFALASGSEVLAYFGRLMDMKLLPSGRVSYHPLSTYEGRTGAGEGRIVSILSGAETTVKIRRKLVDATFYKTSVPATHKRQFAVAEGVEVVPPGDLPRLWMRPDHLPGHYVILGAGKTAMDTGVWLLEAGVPPDRISWVRPRESWLWNRKYTQPHEDFLEAVIGMQIAILEAAGRAQDGAEMVRTLGTEGDYFLRIDPEVEPEMFHYATISQAEIDILRQIKDVIRHGRVQAIERGKLIFADTQMAVPDDTLFIDCTATAVPFTVRDDQGPLFRGDTIVLQPLHVPLVTFSAAVAAFLEANFATDEERNALATPGPLTDMPATFPYAQMITMQNRGAWSNNEKMMAFLARSRLDTLTPIIARLMAEGSPRLAIMQKFGQAAQENMPALIRLGMQGKALHEAA